MQMHRIDEKEDRTIYENRRAEIYGLIRELIDPSNDGFGIPAEHFELRRQLAPIPLTYREGKLYLLPKDKKNKDSKEMTLKDLLGCSPDQGDSFGLACFGLMMASRPKPQLGAVDISQSRKSYDESGQIVSSSGIPYGREQLWEG